MIYIDNVSHDATFNLALEEYVFDCLPKDESYFWLWQNDNTIVVGKHQNTAEEINASFVKAHNINVVRRLSGGGAVYHDLGNVNFTFIANTGNIETLNLQAYCLPVVNTLNKMGVKVELSGRNDLSIEGKKISGNSQYVKNGRIMHHGTLLYDSDLSVVSDALKVSSDKYTSKGFRSVSSRVTNIRPYLPEDMSIESFKNSLRSYMLTNNEGKVYHLTENDLDIIEDIQSKRYQSWDWTYGSSPTYCVKRKRRLEQCGILELFLNVEAGKIKDVQCYGDFFGEGMLPEVVQRIEGARLNEEELMSRLRGFDLDYYFHNIKTEDFVELLIGEDE